MSEYWVSRKRYHCKYCNIYIADDKPSRTQHENGLRHKGNVERFVRGLYKEGEKRVREREEERVIMAGVAKAAETAYALDVASGRAIASSSSLASSSRTVPPPAVQKPKLAKPTNPVYTNHTTTAQSTDSVQDKKRAAVEVEVDDDNMRTFKLRRKIVGPGLGDIFDPELIPIKLKAKKEQAKQEETEETCHPPSLSDKASTSAESEPTLAPRWTKIQWKKVGVDDHSSTVEGGDSGPPEVKIESDSLPLLDIGGTEATSRIESIKAEPTAELVSPSVDVTKKEEDLPQPIDSVSTSGLFRKRKIPARRGV